MKQLARQLFARAGYQVSRSGYRHRFDAMDDALRQLRERGYRPRVVIDAGANVGAWTAGARLHFPQATFHLVEPQPACAARLAEVAGAGDRVHQVAVTAPGLSRVHLIGGGTSGGGTGARIGAAAGHADAVDVAATTLDALLLGHVAADDRALLKLDLEGHECEALRGASGLLERVEVIVAETQFYRSERNGLPLFSDVLGTVEGAGFVLYDIAALAGRPRDGRLRMGDVVFVSSRSPLLEDVRWA